MKDSHQGQRLSGACSRKLRRLSIMAGALFALLFSGCAVNRTFPIGHQIGEPFVFIGSRPAFLAWPPLREYPVELRSTYLPSSNTVEYAQGRDFVVNYAHGTLARLTDSRIPDFRTNILFGQADFDQGKFAGYGNQHFFAYADYYYRKTKPWPEQASQIQFLEKTRDRLQKGEPLKIVAFGDSITAGLNVSKPENIFWRRWVKQLRRTYPHSRITVFDEATPGDTTAQGVLRLKTKVIDEHPDLVLMGFGMNDNNADGYGVSVPQFKQHLQNMIERIHRNTSAEIIIYSAFPPNPQWKFNSHRMSAYAAATRQVARRCSCAYADVFNNWQILARRKKPEDLLANDINHPNDFGQWIYYRVFCALGLTPTGGPGLGGNSSAQTEK